MMNRAEFDALVRKYDAKLLSFMCSKTKHSVAEDMVQETWLSVWKNREKIDTKKFSFGFLKVIAIRRLQDHWRLKRNHEITIASSRRENNRVGNAEGIFETIPAPVEPDRTIDGKIERALDALPSQIRKCFVAVVVDGYTHQEAADKFNITIGTVLSRVHRGKNRLRQLLLGGVKV